MSRPEIILALDLPDGASARRMLERLPDIRWVKVGPILMTREGPDLVRHLVGSGLQVFLDLKWHDIPHTVREAAAAARDLGVGMATVHTLGGREMMAAAAEAAGSELAIVGVTVLTSHTAESYGAATGRPAPDLTQEAIRQARNSVGAGLAGVVCSSREAGSVRAALGAGPRIVVPGIRRAADPADDQNRSATPGEAARAGATHLVVGRPILRAPDPAAAWAALLAELPA